MCNLLRFGTFLTFFILNPMLNGSSGCSKNALNSKWRISKNWEEKHKISNVSIFGNISDIQLKFSVSIYTIFTYI